VLSRNVKIKIYKTVILPMVLHGCETESLILREEERLWIHNYCVPALCPSSGTLNTRRPRSCGCCAPLNIQIDARGFADRVPRRIFGPGRVEKTA
jgi:hypothetical protein